MCMSKPPAVKPIASPPTASPELIDDVAMRERERFRQRSRVKNGRQSTMIAGNVAAPVYAGKTLLGA
jgi:hypothetical protein